MLLKTILGILLLAAAIVAIAATRPNTFHVERSVVINAPAEKIFRLIDDFHNWPAWVPQDCEDPSMKRTFGGPASSLDAFSDWSGKGQTGEGRLTITESVPLQKVAVQADWRRPIETRNINQFTLQPQGAATKVTWRMEGRNLFMMKLVSIFTNMDKMMGRHFEDGLANLKAVAEK